MKVLVVCRYKDGFKDHVAPFVAEQVNALCGLGVDCQWFRVKGKGIRGYLKQLKLLKEEIKAFKPDLIHAHYGLCGLLSCLQHKVPVVVTYHGSDINDPKAFRYSRWAMRHAAWNIFVSRKTMEKARPNRRCSLLPCGVELTDGQQTSKVVARQEMQLDAQKKYVLFAGAFDNEVKNAPLAYRTLEKLDDARIELLELKGYERQEVNLLMCAADALLMTSLNEGSPQVIKEALACGCPIVSVEVGDVKERVEGVGGCFVAQARTPEELAGLLFEAFTFIGKTKGREKIIADGLEILQVATELIKIYRVIIKNNESIP